MLTKNSLKNMGKDFGSKTDPRTKLLWYSYYGCLSKKFSSMYLFLVYFAVNVFNKL